MEQKLEQQKKTKAAIIQMKGHFETAEAVNRADRELEATDRRLAYFKNELDRLKGIIASLEENKATSDILSTRRTVSNPLGAYILNGLS